MKNSSVKPSGAIDKRLRLAERTATGGLLLICVSLVAPFFASSDFGLASALKWVYALGALIYTVARVVGSRVPGDSLRMRRLRRMEFWAGVAFMVAAAFWFYSESHLGPYAGMLALLRQTILFTLVGAAVQVIASWMIVAAGKSEGRAASAADAGKKYRKGEER